MPYIHIADSNDRFSVHLENTQAQETEIDDFKADIVAYVKSRAAELPGVGTIVAREYVEVSTVI